MSVNEPSVEASLAAAFGQSSDRVHEASEFVTLFHCHFEKASSVKILYVDSHRLFFLPSSVLCGK